MALITCPDCGKQVSSLATTCPQCGYPLSSLRSDGEVKIKIRDGLAGTVTIFNWDTEEIIWTGLAGTVAVFTVDKPIEIGVMWGRDTIAVCKRVPKKVPHGIVSAGKRYAVKIRTGFISASPVLVEVDVIDSE